MKKIYVLIFGALFSATEAQLLINDKIYRQMENREKSVRMKTQRIALQDSYIYTIVGTRNFWKETFENSIQKPVFKKKGEYIGIGSRWVKFGTPEYE